jgi:hypothetical protein
LGTGSISSRRATRAQPTWSDMEPRGRCGSRLPAYAAGGARARTG